MISPLPGVTPLVPGSCTLPLPGIMAAIVDETGHDVGQRPRRHPGDQAAVAVDDPHDLGRSRALPQVAITRTSSAASSISRATARCATRTTGYFTIMGRIDDVLNVSGHRLGTMEVESALVANPLVAEAAVVGRPDDMTGEAICAFVVLKQARPDRRRRARRSPSSCATGSARRSARSPSPRTSASATTCRRRARARSCAGCCARSPRARRSRRTCRRWKIRRSWSSSSRCCRRALAPAALAHGVTLARGRGGLGERRPLAELVGELARFG